MQIIDMQVIYGTVDGFLQYVIFVKWTKQKNSKNTYKLNIIEPFDNVSESIPCSAFFTQPSL